MGGALRSGPTRVRIIPTIMGQLPGQPRHRHGAAGTPQKSVHRLRYIELELSGVISSTPSYLTHQRCGVLQSINGWAYNFLEQGLIARLDSHLTSLNDPVIAPRPEHILQTGNLGWVLPNTALALALRS